MKILFAHSFFMDLDQKQRQIRSPYPPLGTLTAAAQAREAGHEVYLFDAMLARGPDELAPRLDGLDLEAVVFFEDNFNWLSKMCLSEMRRACLEMIAAAKQRGLLVIVVGSDPSDEPEPFLEAGANFVIRGEAEFRLLELLAGKGSTAGIVQLRDGVVQSQPQSGHEKDLQRFERPAWDLVEIEAYRAIWMEHHGYFSLNMVTTRGCPYACNWCAKPIHGRRYSARSPEAVASEMAWIKETLAPDHIWFADDIFGLKPGWVERFAEELEAREGSIPFKIQARADLMNASSVAALQRAGCRTVWMGVESGSQRILDAMDKGLEVGDADRASRLLHAAGIEPCFFLQFGYPGEEVSDIQATWELVDRTQPKEIGISVAYPLPGTPFYDRVKDQIEDVDHWQHSHFMQPIFRATYPAEFYPVLYRYIHQLFARNREAENHWVRCKRWVRHQLTRRELQRFGIPGIPF